MRKPAAISICLELGKLLAISVNGETRGLEATIEYIDSIIITRT